MPVLQRSKRPHHERDCRPVGDQIVRITGGYRQGGLRVDWTRLEDAEASRLVELTRKADAEPGAFSLDRLSKKERLRWEQIVEKGADADDVFQASRDNAEFAQAFAELRRETVRPKPLRPDQERGLLLEIHKQAAANCLRLEHIGALVTILAAMQTAEAFAPGSRVDRDGEHTTMIFNQTLGLLGRVDGMGRVGNLKKVLAHLQANAWFELERLGGPEVAIRLGLRGRRALGLERPKKKAAA